MDNPIKSEMPKKCNMPKNIVSAKKPIAIALAISKRLISDVPNALSTAKPKMPSISVCNIIIIKVMSLLFDQMIRSMVQYDMALFRNN